MRCVVHYYQFNIADYRKDTIHLTPIEHYAYRQLLDQYYLTELPIPLDEDKVMRSLCVRIADDMQAVRNVLNDFFLKTENGYIHKRCDVEIESYHSKSKSASDSAKARWAKKNAPDNVIAMRSHTEGNANHKPLTINQEPLKSNTLSESKDSDDYKNYPDFLTFWKEYPDKTGKGDAFKSWKKQKPNLEKVLSALSWQKKSKRWLDGYIPMPATYLNQKRYDDDEVNKELPDWARGAI